MSPSIDDPLLEALHFLGKVHSVPVNLRGATEGLPLVHGRLTPELFPRAAARCGFESKLIKRSLRDIHAATLPVILILKSNDAVILTDPGRGRHAKAEVVVLSSGCGTEKIDRKALEEAYSGVAVLVKPAFRFEQRSDFRGKTLGRHWFWGTLWNFRSFYARVALATLMINFLALSSSIFIMTVYDRVVPNEAVDTLMVLAFGVGVAYLFEFLLKMLRGYFVDRAGHRIDLRLGSELYARILGMKFGNRPPSAGSLASQARSYDSLREFFTSATLAAIVDLPFVFLFAAVIYLLGGGLVALPLIAGILLCLFFGLALQLPISRAVHRSYQSANQRQALVVEGIQALETIKTTRSESELQARMEHTVRVAAKNDGRARAFAQTALHSTGFINHLVSVFIVITAFFQVVEGNMSMGAMIACVLLAGRAMAPMAMVSSLLSRLQQSRRALQGIDQIMQSPVERDEQEARFLSIRNFLPRIEAHEASFSHVGGGEEVLKRLDFRIEPGERVALLGRIGSGKSTLLRTLVGLYHPTGGRIDISGIDLRQLDPADLRRHVGYVPQSPAPLYGTIRSNVKAGCPWIEEEAVLRAIERAGLASYIRSLPEGLDTPVSEAGASLSGGQRQALAVARALVEEPPLLLLDEPTSAMDLASERALIDHLRAYLGEDASRTLLIATHKRSVLALVDRIIVLDRGRILADGPRDVVLRPSSPPRERPGAASPQDAGISENPDSAPVALPR